MKRSLDDILNTIISESRSEEVEKDLRKDQDFRELEHVWKLYDQVWQEEATDATNAWDAIDGHIKREKSAGRILSIYRHHIGIAASFLALIGLALFYLRPQDPYITYQALAQDESVVLPDNSTVDLKQGAQIRYLRDDLFTEDERIVFLDGEAVFDVHRNESLPFKVISNSTTVDVLGTKFSYLAEDEYSESENISGLVKFLVNEDTTQQRILNPGDKISYDGEELVYTPVEIPPPPIPRNQLRVDDLIDILGDRYPVRLTYPGTMDFNQVVVAVDLRGDLQDILADLDQNEAVQIEYVKTGSNRYTLIRLRAQDQGLRADYSFDAHLMGRPYAQ